MGRGVRLMLVVLAFTALLAAPVDAADPVMDRAVVRVTAQVPPVASVEITRGSLLTFEHDGQTGAIRLPDALAFHIQANAPWQIQAQTVAPFGLRVLRAGGAITGSTRQLGSESVAVPAGEQASRWDVIVLVPPGTPAGRYQIPVSLMVSLDVP